MNRGQVIVVEGIIGAGKSSFSRELASALGEGTLYQQEPDEKNNANPYLASFYNDSSRWAYTMQTHLLQMRYKMHLNAQWHSMTTGNFSVLDRSYFGDTAFANLQLEMGDMTQDEFDTYQSIYHAMTASVLLPTFCIHLNVRPSIAQRRIVARMEKQTGRKCESAIELQYLESLRVHEDNVVNALDKQGVRVLSIDWNEDRSDPLLRRDMVLAMAEYIKNYDTPIHNNLLDLHRRTV